MGLKGGAAGGAQIVPMEILIALTGDFHAIAAATILGALIDNHIQGNVLNIDE